MNLDARMPIAGGARFLDCALLAKYNAVQIFASNQVRRTTPPLQEDRENLASPRSLPSRTAGGS